MPNIDHFDAVVAKVEFKNDWSSHSPRDDESLSGLESAQPHANTDLTNHSYGPTVGIVY